MAIAHQLAKRSPFYYGWVVLLAAGSSQFVRNAAASLTIAVFIYPISQELGWSRTLIAGAASLGGLASTGASPLVGWLIDKYGARIVLAISVLILGISTISLAWATVPLAFYLAYATGRVIFSSPIQIGASVVVSRWFIRKRGRASGILFMSHSAGMITFPLLASFIIQIRGWEQAWIILGILVLAVALIPVSLLIVQRPEDVGLLPDGDKATIDGASGESTQAANDPEWTLKQAMHTPTLWILAIAIGLLFLMQAGTNTHLGAYFRDQGMGAAAAGLAISFNAAFTGIGSMAWGWIVEKIPVRYGLAGVALFMAIASALFITADQTWEALAYSGLFGFGLGGLLAIPPVAYADYFGRRSLGTIRGVTEPFTSLGQAFGALMAGAVFDFTGSYEKAFLTFTILGVITLVVLLTAKPPRRPAITVHAGE